MIDYWALIFVLLGFVGGYIAGKFGERFDHHD